MKYSRKGIIVPTIALLFIVIVVYAYITYFSAPIGVKAYIGERAADIISASKHADLDLLGVEKCFDSVKDKIYFKLGLNFDVNKDVKEQYLEFFKKDFAWYISNYLRGYEQNYSLDIVDEKIVLEIKLISDGRNVKYEISEEFKGDVELSEFERLKIECVDDIDNKYKKIKTDLDGNKKCSDFYNGAEIKKKCGECIVSSDDKFLKFEFKTKILGEEIPVKYKIEAVKSL